MSLEEGAEYDGLVVNDRLRLGDGLERIEGVDSRVLMDGADRPMDGLGRLIDGAGDGLGRLKDGLGDELGRLKDGLGRLIDGLGATDLDRLDIRSTIPPLGADRTIGEGLRLTWGLGADRICGDGALGDWPPALGRELAELLRLRNCPCADGPNNRPTPTTSATPQGPQMRLATLRRPVAPE